MYNNKQLEAITSRDRFIFVNAGAGSGKTTVMIERIRTLLKEGVLPDTILGLTFSREAATQMKNRLNNDSVMISTFHSFCYQFIKDKDIFNQIYPFHQELILNISLFKNQLRKKPLGFKKYQAYLNKQGLIDYDDMLILFLQRHINLNYEHILIDEFQDTNYLQMQVLIKLIGPKTHVFVVGDPDQSIYRFRGAMPSVIHHYINYFKAKVLTLNQNYRSDISILEVANQLIQHNQTRLEKDLISTSPLLGKVAILMLNSHQYTNTIIDMIQTYKYQSYAILSRTHQALYDIKIDVHEHVSIFKRDKVSILTLHESKGLEFDVVFIIGIDSYVLPHYLSTSKESIEEERRLFYVGITRAKHELYFIHTHNKQEKHKNVKLSRFIYEISENKQFKPIK